MNCLNCTKDFTPKHPAEKNCSSRCKREWRLKTFKRHSAERYQRTREETIARSTLNYHANREDRDQKQYERRIHAKKQNLAQTLNQLIKGKQ